MKGNINALIRRGAGSRQRARAGRGRAPWGTRCHALGVCEHTGAGGAAAATTGEPGTCWAHTGATRAACRQPRLTGAAGTRRPIRDWPVRRAPQAAQGSAGGQPPPPQAPRYANAVSAFSLGLQTHDGAGNGHGRASSRHSGKGPRWPLLWPTARAPGAERTPHSLEQRCDPGGQAAAARSRGGAGLAVAWRTRPSPAQRGPLWGRYRRRTNPNPAPRS